MAALDQFLLASTAEVARRAALAPHRPVLARGAAAFADAVRSMQPIDRGLSVIGVMSELDDIEASLAPHPALAALAVKAAADVPWVPTPRLDRDDGDHVGLGLVDQVRDLGEITCGFMLLSPGATYPVHSHPPQEIYLPLAGAGSWRFGGAADYRHLDSNELVYNNPGDEHSATAADTAELALYFLWPS